MKLMRFVYPFLTVYLMLGVSVSAQAATDSESSPVVYTQTESSTYFRAVFAQFLAVIPNPEQPNLKVDSAISVSNICAAPDSVSFLIGLGPSRGAVTIVLYDRDGTKTTFTTNSDAIGFGLNPDGTLGPGQTWTVRLAEVISAARGIPESQVNFSGYGWILSGFDCLAGTYSNTIFGLGFTQAYELLPAMGQGGFFGGVMVPQP